MATIKNFVNRHNYIAALLFVIIGLSLMIALTACGSKQAVSADPQASAATVEEPAPEAPPAVNEFIKQFGEIVTFEDGLSISMSAPVDFTPTDLAAGVDQANNVMFSITVTNNTGEPLEPMFDSSGASGGVPASKIFDIDNPVGGVFFAPTTTILPGQTLTWNEAYSVADPTNITIDFFVGFDYEKAIFTNVAF